MIVSHPLLVGLGVAVLINAVIVLIGLKFIFWSGSLPPNAGWSRKQTLRMARGQSPWTIGSWLTYRSPGREYKDARRDDGKNV